MNYSVLFSIKIGGPSKNLEILKKALISISSKIFTKNYQIFLFYETSNTLMTNFIEKIEDKKVIIKKVEKNYSWYNWIKNSSVIAKDFDYLYLMHDDIFFLTKHFDRSLNQKISNMNNIGIVNLKDMLYEDGYYKSQTRHGFFIDNIYDNSSEKGLFAEFYMQKPYWHTRNIRVKNLINKVGLSKNLFIKSIFNQFFFDIKKMNIPNGTIRAHGGYNDLMIFQKNNLYILDNICDFEIPYGLHSDEDICLESLKSGMNNILISDISYKSNYEFNFVTTRSYELHQKNKKKCDIIFKKKWGYDIDMSKMNINEKLYNIQKAKTAHGNKIVWTKDFNSFDYQYL
jgi:hypothetical protein